MRPHLRHLFRQGLVAILYKIPVLTVRRHPQALRFWGELARLVYQWAGVAEVPILDLNALYPGIENQPVVVGFPGSRLSIQEQVCMAQLLAFRRPKIVFEIGTAYGGTTVLMAANLSDDAQISTLDLPLGCERRTSCYGPTITDQELGACFRGTVHERKIRQLYGDSRFFDFSPWKGQVDLVFIDGGHEYEVVQNDTRKALDMISPQGIVVWHDYPSWPGVYRVVHDLARTEPIFQIRHTRLALLDTGLRTNFAGVRRAGQ
ncbi:MAG: class I SAM-dependent methyltransferase [Candidatus Methanomethyliaceae archaeon]